MQTIVYLANTLSKGDELLLPIQHLSLHAVREAPLGQSQQPSMRENRRDFCFAELPVVKLFEHCQLLSARMDEVHFSLAVVFDQSPLVYTLCRGRIPSG